MWGEKSAVLVKHCPMFFITNMYSRDDYEGGFKNIEICLLNQNNHESMEILSAFSLMA
jgi:hypothetical protein